MVVVVVVVVVGASVVVVFVDSSDAASVETRSSLTLGTSSQTYLEHQEIHYIKVKWLHDYLLVDGVFIVVCPIGVGAHKVLLVLKMILIFSHSPVGKHDLFPVRLVNKPFISQGS